ncbi:MAG: retropepsin-like aspartic protease [Akkermansiaceae bacterium]|nr:retropepsin-like aspartic protease [Akkermansiaceae bacterium]
MNQILMKSFASFLACLVLTQCSGMFGSTGSRSSELNRLGYESVPLQKEVGDSRYSGVFKVNGSPMRFLIDSGANGTDVDQKLAASVGLRPSGSVKVITRGALGREVASGRGVGSLQIGSMIARQFPYTIAPSHGRKTSTSSYAGQVGLDALSATGALIDIPSARMWIPGPRSQRGESPLPIALGPRSGLGDKILELGTASRLPHLILRGSLKGRLVTWVVDTGAEVSVMAAESFDRFNIPSRPTNSRMIDASGDRVALRHARLQHLRFGDVDVAVFDISVAPLGTVRQYFRDSNGRPVDGILGMDFLMTGGALLDSGSGLIYLGSPRR